MTNLLCVTSNEKGEFYTGAQNGYIYKWGGNSILASKPVHNGIVHCIRYVKEPNDDTAVLMTGAAD